ncbi:hypothetical protein SUZIE_169660 [Sciurus carolinensis]|uniref:Uncharacterized protein n=1 Tax=Sciurus carolinensis TaxID=30640 RepID=A0AA41T3U9_SCICA|nr:hypothetical protein [Sciurus carolinensis]
MNLYLCDYYDNNVVMLLDFQDWFRKGPVLQSHDLNALSTCRETTRVVLTQRSNPAKRQPDGSHYHTEQKDLRCNQTCRTWLKRPALLGRLASLVDSAAHTCCNARRLPCTKFSPTDADPAQEGLKVRKVIADSPSPEKKRPVPPTVPARSAADPQGNRKGGAGGAGRGAGAPEPGLVRAALAAGAHTVQEAEAAALRRGLPRRLACAGRGVGRLGERRRDQAKEEGSGGAEEEENAEREEELASRIESRLRTEGGSGWLQWNRALRREAGDVQEGSVCSWELISEWSVPCASPQYVVHSDLHG